MYYFENLPIVDYDSLDSEEIVKLRNIFWRLELGELDTDLMRYYRIDGDKRLDTISFELYGTPHYWWIISFINNIQDIIFDLPLKEDMLQQIATDRALAVYPTLSHPGALAYRSEQLDELVAEYDEKRLIRVVNQAYIGRVITEILKSL
jgi:hypothetical protein